MSEASRGGRTLPVLQPVLLRATGVAKSFGATQALRSASFELRAGEVHAIVGENGSGKSTLVKILTGVHRPDAGSMELDGAHVGWARTPNAALESGIAAVFQEVLVVEPRSVLENVWLGTDGLLRRTISERDKRRRATELLAELMEVPPRLNLPVEALSLSERQACCIARALVRDPAVLILDEATSALDIATRERLFGLLRQLAAQGAAVIFISHRMDEISEIADRCTVMRSGETVATLDRDQASAGELVRLMTGADHLTQKSARQETRRPHGATVLRTNGLVLRPGAAPINVEIRAGELVGLAGLEGHGQEAFLSALWGTGAVAGAVMREGDDGTIALTSSREAAREGVALVPRERRAEALLESKSVRENFALPTLRRDVRHGLVWPSLSRARLAPWIARLNIKLGDAEDPITSLSGGNQQKVVIARWLASDPRVLLLNDPTRGIDIAAKRDLYDLLISLAGEGVAIVMVSTEVDEHVELMDRVLVFREDELSCEIGRDALTREALVSAFFAHNRSEARHD
ncbi:sugar ABC transporter ATP-binding protein [Baekduia alba]|uniref:sugar ABC transporter ATP-binding protein n=1 Tax=Baekduia alba TaxID=2997333 RepID=UPI002342569E|nr:sugar ABC transporter ATP-binding protein [Baekduia alba]